MSDNALHATWVTWNSVKKQLLAEARGELSQAGTFGAGSISGVDTTPFLDKVTNTLFSLGISAKDGVVSIANLAVKKSDTEIARIKKIEMVDDSTGEIYCTWISNGEWQKVKGNCDNVVANATTTAQPVQGSSQAPNNQAAAPTSSSFSTQNQTGGASGASNSASSPAPAEAAQPAQPAQPGTTPASQVLGGQAEQIIQQAQAAAQNALETTQHAQEAVQEQTQQVVHQAQQAAQQAQAAAQQAQQAVQAINSNAQTPKPNQTLNPNTQNATAAQSGELGAPAGAPSSSAEGAASEEFGHLNAPAEQSKENGQNKAGKQESMGDLIKKSAAGLLNAIWDFVSGIFSASWRIGVKKVSEVPFVKSATVSILQNSEKFKQSGLLSPEAQNFTASLFGIMESLLKVFSK